MKVEEEPMKVEAKPKRRKINMPDQVQMSFVKTTDADYCALHAKLEANVKKGMDEEKLRLCEDCAFVTTSHQRTKSRQLSRLLNFMHDNESTHADLVKPVVIGNEAVPRFFIVFAGEPLAAKMATKLGNDASVNLTENMASLRHKSASAHKSCNRKSGISKTNKYKELGIIKN